MGVLLRRLAAIIILFFVLTGPLASGLNYVTVYVTDEDNKPVPDIRVDVYHPIKNITYHYLEGFTTNEYGYVTLTLSPGDYELRAGKTGYQDGFYNGYINKSTTVQLRLTKPLDFTITFVFFLILLILFYAVIRIYINKKIDKIKKSE